MRKVSEKVPKGQQNEAKTVQKGVQTGTGGPRGGQCEPNGVQTWKNLEKVRRIGLPIDPEIAPKTAKCAKSEEKRLSGERLGRAIEKTSKNGLSLQEPTCVSTTPVQSKHSFQNYHGGDPNYQK